LGCCGPALGAAAGLRATTYGAGYGASKQKELFASAAFRLWGRLVLPKTKEGD